MSTLNPFTALGLKPGASEVDIKKSFRKLALIWHPDKNPHRKDEATKKFQDLNDAYNVLADAKTRREAELKWSTTTKTSTRSYYSYHDGTPASNTRSGWGSQRHWDDPFSDNYSGWSYHGFFGNGGNPSQQSKSSKSRSKSSAYDYYSQRDNSNRYAYDHTPTGANGKYKTKTRPKPKYESKPKPEPRTETKPPKTYSTSRNDNKSQSTHTYVPPQFKSTAGDPKFNRKTGYSYMSGERYTPGNTPNVKPPVYEDETPNSTTNNQEDDTEDFHYRFERERHPHSSSGKGEKYRVYDEPPARDRPTTGSFNFTMPNMKTSHPSSSANAYRENHSFMFGQNEDHYDEEEDLSDPYYQKTSNPFGFNSTFVDLTNTDDEVEELSPDEYREIAREAQKKKEQRTNASKNSQKDSSQNERYMSVDTSDEGDYSSQDLESDLDQNMSGDEGYESHTQQSQKQPVRPQPTQPQYERSKNFGSNNMFSPMPFDKEVLESMFRFSLGTDGQFQPRKKPSSSQRKRRPEVRTHTSKFRQPTMEEVSDSESTDMGFKTSFPRETTNVPPSKKINPESTQTPLFDVRNIHPFNETNGNFEMDEMRKNIDQIGGDKVNATNINPIGDDENIGGISKSRNTTSEPVNTSTSRAFKPEGATSFTKLNIDLAVTDAHCIQPPSPPTFVLKKGEDSDSMLARYLREFHEYQKFMDIFYTQCAEYRRARLEANRKHANVLNSTSVHRKANIEAREIDAMVLEREYSATRKHAEALEKYDAISTGLR